MYFGGSSGSEQTVDPVFDKIDKAKAQTPLDDKIDKESKAKAPCPPERPYECPNGTPSANICVEDASWCPVLDDKIEKESKAKAIEKESKAKARTPLDAEGVPKISYEAMDAYSKKDYDTAIKVLFEDVQKKGFMGTEGACDSFRLLAGFLARKQRSKQALLVFPDAIEACVHHKQRQRLPILLHNYAATLLQSGYNAGGEEYEKARQTAIPLLEQCLEIDPKEKACRQTLEQASVTSKGVAEKMEAELAELSGGAKAAGQQDLSSEEMGDL
jgi:hypothetical protein